MKKRLFIAIPLDETAKFEAGELVEALPQAILRNRSVRVVPPENWHLTLLFLGYIDDAELPSLVDILGAAARQFSPPDVEFTSLHYGPPGKSPRMIWLRGTPMTSEVLGQIRKFLESALREKRTPFDAEHRAFEAHVTIARFSAEIGRNMLPELPGTVHVSFSASELMLMESELSPRGPRYICLHAEEFSGRP